MNVSALPPEVLGDIFHWNVDHGREGSCVIPFNEEAWKRGLKEPRNPLMYWV
jgi:hypothetical protein